MQSRVVHSEDPRIVVVVGDKGEDAVAAVIDAAERHGISAAQVTAVGGFRSATLGYFDAERRQFKPIAVNEQVEVLSFLGDIATADGRPVLHAHVVLGRRDGSTVGGHLQAAHVWPTLEVVVTEVASHLAKHLDPETGLALISLK